MFIQWIFVFDENNSLVDTGNVLPCRGESFFEGSVGDTSGLMILLRFRNKHEKGNDGYGRKEENDKGAVGSRAQVYAH